MKWLVLIALCLPAQAVSYYYTYPSSSGSNTGANCANGYAYNDATHGLQTSSAWTAGNTLTLCGTWNDTTAGDTLITAQGSGTNGNPITVLFDCATSATLQDPYWAQSVGGTSAGAITLGSGHSYITINGQGCGVIQNTQNGSASSGLTYSHESTGISLFNCTGCIVENLTIANLYVQVTGDATAILPGGTDSSTVRAIDPTGQNITISGNTIHDCGWCILDSYNNSDTNLTVSGNNIYNFGHALAFSAASQVTCTSPCLTYSGNLIHDPGNWANSGCTYHDDGLHTFGVVWSGTVNTSGTAVSLVSGDNFQSGFAGQNININSTVYTVQNYNSATSLTLTATAGTQTGVSYNETTLDKNVMDGIYVSNNYVYGNWGTCPTGFIFVEGGTSTSASHAHNIYMWNNVFIATSQQQNTNGWVDIASGSAGSQYFISNTILGDGSTTDNDFAGVFQNANALTVEDNVFSGSNNPISIANSTLTAVDYNLYGANVCDHLGNCFNWNGSYEGSFSAWKTACACDSHSISNTTPNINADGSPQSSFVGIREGANLGSLATGNLASLANDTTKGGNRAALARPASGTCSSQGSLPCWDIGAYQYTAGTSPNGVGTPAGMFAELFGGGR